MTRASLATLRLAATAGMVAVLLALGGCATSANQESMAPVVIESTKKLPHSIRVETRGGSDTGLTDSSNVSNADLKAAIEASIRQSGLFKSVAGGPDGDYLLTVTIAGLDKPMFGGAFTVTVDAGWSLVRARDGAVVLRKAVRTAHTAQMSDSLVGVTRLRLALEGAVRKNIAEGLQAVGDAPL